jgi:hypothetical protein
VIEDRRPELAERVGVVGNEWFGHHDTYRRDDCLAGEAVGFVSGTEQVTERVGEAAGTGSPDRPAVENVGGLFLIAGTIGTVRDDEAMLLVEISSPMVGSEGPELEALGRALLGHR